MRTVVVPTATIRLPSRRARSISAGSLRGDFVVLGVQAMLLHHFGPHRLKGAQAHVQCDLGAFHAAFDVAAQGFAE